jgi:hypothetical protein
LAGQKRLTTTICFAAGNPSNSIYFFEQSVSLSKDYSNPESVFNSNKYLAYMDSSNITAVDLYFKGFQNYIETSDQVDVRLFEHRITECLNEGDYEKSVWYSDLIIGIEGLNNHSGCVKLLSILYLKMNALQNSSDQLDIALKVKDIISKTEGDDLKVTVITKDSLNFMKKETEKLLISIKPVEQVVRSKRRYGRNERITVRYEDGRVDVKKYKQVEESIEAGSCTIVG